MKNGERQNSNRKHGIMGIMRMDISCLLRELGSIENGLIAVRDKELYPIIEYPINNLDQIKKILPLSTLAFSKLNEAAGAGPQVLGNQLLAVIGIPPRWTGTIFPLSHVNLQGFMLILGEDHRVFTDVELRRLNTVAELVSNHYGTLLSIIKTAGIANEVLDSLDIGIYTVSKNGTMIQFNRAAEVLFRYDARNIVGFHYLECLAPEQRDNVKRIIDYVMEKKQIYSGGHIRFITLNQEEIILSSTIFPWLDENGELLGVVGLVQNETKRDSFQKRLIQLEKMTLINRMATNISQEVHEPLAAIRGFARMIEKKETADANNRKYAQIIVEEVDRINKAVNNLLDLSRPLDIELNRLNLNEVITETCKRVLGNNSMIYLTLCLDENLPMIEGHAEKLSQLFSDILTNAVDSMEHGGLIDILSEVVGERLKVVVQDNGCGISKSLQDKIFDPFFTTKDDRVGVGLAKSRQIMARHGGWISVRSKENEGTSVLLEFPLARG